MPIGTNWSNLLTTASDRNDFVTQIFNWISVTGSFPTNPGWSLWDDQTAGNGSGPKGGALDGSEVDPFFVVRSPSPVGGVVSDRVYLQIGIDTSKAGTIYLKLWRFWNLQTHDGIAPIHSNNASLATEVSSSRVELVVADAAVFAFFLYGNQNSIFIATKVTGSFDFQIITTFDGSDFWADATPFLDNTITELTSSGAGVTVDVATPGNFNIGQRYFLIDDYDPITITGGSNDKLDFDDGAPVTATLTAGKFSRIELAAELKTQMDAVGSQTYTVTYNDVDGKFTVSAAGVFSADWATTVNSVGASMGFTADDAASSSYVSDVIAPVAKSEKVDFVEVSGIAGSTLTLVNTNNTFAKGARIGTYPHPWVYRDNVVGTGQNMASYAPRNGFEWDAFAGSFLFSANEVTEDDIGLIRVSAQPSNYDDLHIAQEIFFTIGNISAGSLRNSNGRMHNFVRADNALFSAEDTLRLSVPAANTDYKNFDDTNFLRDTPV